MSQNATVTLAFCDIARACQEFANKGLRSGPLSDRLPFVRLAVAVNAVVGNGGLDVEAAMTSVQTIDEAIQVAEAGAPYSVLFLLRRFPKARARQVARAAGGRLTEDELVRRFAADFAEGGWGWQNHDDLAWALENHKWFFAEAFPEVCARLSRPKAGTTRRKLWDDAKAAGRPWEACPGQRPAAAPAGGGA